MTGQQRGRLSLLSPGCVGGAREQPDPWELGRERGPGRDS